MAATQREFLQVVRIAFAGLVLAVHALGASPAAAQMFEGGIDVPTGGTEESVIAVNPMNPDNIAVASNDPEGQIMRISTDGGLTFSEPIYPRRVARYGGVSDPSLAFDSRGRLFWTHLGGRLTNPGRNHFEVFISQVDPKTGETLPGYPVNVSAAAGFPASEGHWNHKEWIAVDHHRGSPYRDRIYVVWTDELTRGDGPVNDGSVVTAYSADQGATWSEGTVLFTSTESFPISHNAVAANGDVYVAYSDEPLESAGGAGRVVVHRSTDGGASYSQVSTAYAPGAADVTPNFQTLPRVLYKSVSATIGSRQPWLLPDPWDSSAIYVVTADDPTNLDHGAGFDDLGVFIARSQDGGMSWSEPARIDSDPGASHQIFPTASIDDVTGCLAVTWYDSRVGLLNPAGNFLLDLFLTSSSDGGLTFGPEVPINDAPFDPERNPPPINPRTLSVFIGDYNGVAVSRGVAHATWTSDWLEDRNVLFDRATVCDGPAPVDIKPGSEPNAINLSEEGVVAVALLGREGLDVTEVDVTTLAFGSAGATFDHSHGPHFDDVDGDGFLDLVSHYRIEKTGIEFGDREACLRGKLMDGMRFGGCDGVRTVPDMDGDKLLDIDEANIGTDALNADSDADGYGDGDEVLVMGTDPLDPLDPTSAPPPGRRGIRNRRR